MKLSFNVLLKYFISFTIIDYNFMSIKGIYIYLVLLLASKLCYSEDCNAPLGVYGELCESSMNLTGSLNTQVLYTIKVKDSSVQCLARGLSNGNFGIWDVGTFSDRSPFATLDW